MVGSMTFFVLNDAFMKALGAEWPLFQSLFIRGIGVVLVMLVLAAALGQLTVRLPRRDWLILLIRTLCEMGAAYFFISAIFNMPLADATTIMQSLPLTITMAGALFLGERVGPRRWAAIGVGFVGVILIVRPGFEGFSIYSVYVLITVVLITLRDMAVRQMSRSVPTVLTALLSAFGVMLLGAVGSVGEVWAPSTGQSLMQNSAIIE
ncbi:MAG: DMT family transporter [Pseudomonadota bacterium]